MNADHPPERVRALYGAATSPLLERYPGLRGRLPWLPLAELPTPVEPLPHPEAGARGTLLVKRDDLSSSIYGGNKVRKLEHLLARARLEGGQVLVTLGAMGSNHALATALHGRGLGFEVEVALFPQPVTRHVRRNLLAHARLGTRVHHCGGGLAALWSARRKAARRRRGGRNVCFLMAGGTDALGTVGHVGAALELAAQVAAGELPEPDAVFVAAGTCGTAAGLVLGLRLAGLRTRVHAVRVLDPHLCNRFLLRRYARAANRLLRRCDLAVPDVRVRLDDFVMETRYFGGYGVTTPAAAAALAWAGSRLELEPTYTGKALAACLDHCRGEGSDRTVLFWNTVSSAPLPEGPEDALPPPLRAALSAAEADTE